MPSDSNSDYADTSSSLRQILETMSHGQDEDAMALLEGLVAREPESAYAHYLLGALHAQAGLTEQAETSFRTAAQLAPDFQIARFQLGQLLLVLGRIEEARTELAPLADPTLQSYANGLLAAADGNLPAAIELLETGLELPQDNAPLAEDMHRLVAKLRANVADSTLPPVDPTVAPGASMLLSNYGRLS